MEREKLNATTARQHASQHVSRTSDMEIYQIASNIISMEAEILKEISEVSKSYERRLKEAKDAVKKDYEEQLAKFEDSLHKKFLERKESMMEDIVHKEIYEKKDFYFAQILEKVFTFFGYPPTNKNKLPRRRSS